MFLKYSFLHHLPIVDNGQLTGIISTNDVMRAYHEATEKLNDHSDEAYNDAFKISDIMTKDPINVAPETSVEHAIRIFNENDFQALPIVDLGKLVGILTIKDLVNLMYE